MGDGKLLTIEDVAGFLDVSASTVYGLAQRGEIEGVRVGSQWRFRPQAIVEYLDRNKAATGVVEPAEAAA